MMDVGWLLGHFEVGGEGSLAVMREVMMNFKTKNKTCLVSQINILKTQSD